MSRMIFMAALSVAVAAGLAAPGQAQGNDASQQSAEELQQLFEQQKTRGLVIAPAAGGEAQTNPNEAAMAKATVYTPVEAGTEINVRISFDFDSALLREDQKPKLATLCEALTNMEGQVFRIVGHTDSKGSEAYNQSLSLLRASEVKRYMVGTCGIDEGRLLAIGAGEEHPVNADDPTAQENRRVEFQLIS